MLRRSFCVACIALDASAFSIPPFPYLSHLGVARGQQQQHPLQENLETWLAREERIALDKLLANVAPGGRNVEGQGVVPGTVVASPSREEPDYWYQCRQTMK